MRTGEKFREGCFLSEDCVLLLELSVVKFWADWRRRSRCVCGLGGGCRAATRRGARDGVLSLVGDVDMVGLSVLQNHGLAETNTPTGTQKNRD